MYQDTRKKTISRQPICLTDSDYDYILKENDRLDKEVFSDDMEDYFKHFN